MVRRSRELDTVSALPELGLLVGENLRRERVARGLSLGRLSAASGVSRAMLSQVELGKSVPTINVLWRIAKALGLQLSSLISDGSDRSLTVLRANTSKVIASSDGTVTLRALFPADRDQAFEFYELRLAGRSTERVDAQPPATQENLVVAEGTLTLSVGATRHQLAVGDAVLFDADRPHEYRNEADMPARAYLLRVVRHHARNGQHDGRTDDSNE